MSPSTVQNDGFAQTPALHQPDAHCELVVQGFPLVGFGPSGVQVPPPLPSGAHVPPQQSELRAHASLSATHCTLEHVPPAHEPVQHWFPVVHATPGNAQPDVGLAHFPLTVSQFAEQHSVLFVHAAAVAVQAPASARLPSMVLTKPSVPLSSPGLTPVSGGLVVLSSPPSVSPIGVVSSLPHPTKTTFVIATAASRPSAAQGSFLMIPILHARASAQR
jgi:hypothetical protein